LDSTLAVERLGLDPVEVFSTLLALLSEGIGRVALSKKLGFPERTVRKVVTLVKTGELSWLRGVFIEISVTSINAPWLNCQPVLYEGFNSGLLDTVRENIVLLRDFIVISSREPGKVEVIGVLIGDNLVYPGLVEEYSEPYLKLRELLPRTTGLLVCWRSYRRYLDDSILIASLAYLCKHSD
jgi:hypothetical protein